MVGNKNNKRHQLKLANILSLYRSRNQNRETNSKLKATTKTRSRISAIEIFAISFSIMMVGCTNFQREDIVNSLTEECKDTKIQQETIDTSKVVVLPVNNGIEIHNDSGKISTKISTSIYFVYSNNRTKNILPFCASNGIEFHVNDQQIKYEPEDINKGTIIESCPSWSYPGFRHYFGKLINQSLITSMHRDGRVVKEWTHASGIDTSTLPILSDSVLSDNVIRIDYINRQIGTPQRIDFDFSAGTIQLSDSFSTTKKMSVYVKLDTVPFSHFQPVTACGYEHYDINIKIWTQQDNCDTTKQICMQSFRYKKSLSSKADSAVCLYRIAHP